MPSTLTYPGVYVEEIPSGVRTIAGVSTSNTAFVGYFPRGPVDRAVRLTSFADFEREFGGLDTRSEASYAIRQYYLNGGSVAFVVRVTDATAAEAQVSANDATPVLAIEALNPGAVGNTLRIAIDTVGLGGTGEFNFTVLEDTGGGPTVIQTFSDAVISDPTDPNFIETLVNGISAEVQVQALDTALPAVTGPTDPSADVNPHTLIALTGGDAATPASGTASDGGQDVLTITAANPGVWGDALEVAIDTQVGPDGEFNLLVRRTVRRDGRTVVLEQESFRNLVITNAGSPRYVEDVLRERSSLVTADVLAASVPTATGATDAASDPDAHTFLSLTGGADGPVPGEAALRGSEAAKTGMYALLDIAPEVFNLLCLPAVANMSDADATTVYTEAATFCEAERAFLLCDVASDDDDPAAALGWMQNVAPATRNGAVYFPRLVVPDPLNENRPREVAASGTVAGVYARTDATRGVWKAPAGTEASLRGASLAVNLSDGQNGQLNPRGINAFRAFPVYGRVVWGARTLRGDDMLADEYKYVPVRRLALYIEESLFQGLQWVVFEPNDEPLWSQIRLNVGAFMQTLFRQGAFQGRSPREAYFVRCDRTTTTQNDIDRGVVNILVGFAPLKPAEFVVLQLQQIAGQLAT